MTKNRPVYIEKVRNYMYRQIIKVFVGQRRVGKSVLLKQISELVKKEKHNANIVFINKEDLAFEFIKNYQDLVTYAENKRQADVDNFLFIDEIQDIEKFRLIIKTLFVQALENVPEDKLDMLIEALNG